MPALKQRREGAEGEGKVGKDNYGHKRHQALIRGITDVEDSGRACGVDWAADIGVCWYFLWPVFLFCAAGPRISCLMIFVVAISVKGSARRQWKADAGGGLLIASGLTSLQ